MLGALLCAGCVTTTSGYIPPKPMKTTVNDNKEPNPLEEQSVVGNISSDDAVMTDPSAARLHEIAGNILLYLAVNSQMPKSLQDLKTVADEDLNLICPQTNSPYVYVPEGLHAPGKTKAVVVYEPAARPNGTRWCILMAEPRPGAAPAMEVLQMSDALFLGYR